MLPITHKLITWFIVNKRPLPWRETSDSYKIWLSEVILQQTRVNQGMDYYHRFTEAFPDVKALADASEEQVLKLWQGLGYYSRARNLHQTARRIMADYSGKFPSQYSELIKLKGVGEYTAAAIASIAFNEAVPVIDGNVARVLSRLYYITEPVDSSAGKKMLAETASAMLDRENPGTWNQAIMEFGALHCKPSSPDCLSCPVQEHCLAYMKKATENLPVKKGKIKATDLYLYFLVHVTENKGIPQVILNHRKVKGIWKNLYDFPSIESLTPIDMQEVLLQLAQMAGLKTGEFSIVSFSGEYIHKLTHRTIHAFFLETSGPVQTMNNAGFILAGKNHVHQYPVPKLIERYLMDSGVINFK